jgi:hypothetical protein
MRIWLASGLAICLTGCAAAFQSYDKALDQSVDQVAAGNVDSAIKALDAANPGARKDLLYYLELGMLQRLGSRTAQSQKAWAAAQASALPEEQGAKERFAGLLQSASSYLVNDRLRPYPGYDYEKTMLLTHMALNQLALSDFDQARVAIKQTHELEAMIAEERGKQIAEVEEDARKRGARTSFRELNGYPVQTIDNPAVNTLRNSYQSALSHYLAGFVYEALGEPSLAAPGYRLANELQPDQPLLEEALRGLDQRAGAPADDLVDTLFVIGTGTAPALHSRQFMLPVPTLSGMIHVTVSFPVMAASGFSAAPSQVSVDGDTTLAIAPITSIDLMARRRLKDDMSAIMLRATVRAATRAVLQAGLQQQGRGGDKAAAVGALAAFVVAAGSMVIEQADERTWRMLPSEFSIARVRLPAGAHSVTLQTPAGPHSAKVELSGRYAVVELRLLRNRLIAIAPSTRGAPGSLEPLPQPKENPK